MNRRAITLFVCTLACFAAGCSDNGEVGSEGPAEGSFSEIAVSIAAPATGSVLSGGEGVNFVGEATGGKKPYSYRWSSSLDGTLSTERSFSKPPSEMSRGRYVVVLTVTDDAGATGQASTTLTVL
ncbi:PKD domain-containing protein [Methanotrichaceae archaeon M04Ac]|uniref:PKD domain-containing protein n=1 Tax=Candidatus Methanocrinis alkalitolerans TaxID=3033395 RepID=A0ABT5XE98_9EURY|nr:PKD domain-containing protein [Candidatus Methanocrinis alkalitolerans]MCR3884219.1 PKD domain-containing protein [Methanothrix sp.]MDF0593044.1 PKD domain-containing protein [Candidatus Methanocrinis alkalitolerans]